MGERACEAPVRTADRYVQLVAVAFDCWRPDTAMRLDGYGHRTLGRERKQEVKWGEKATYDVCFKPERLLGECSFGSRPMQRLSADSFLARLKNKLLVYASDQHGCIRLIRLLRLLVVVGCWSSNPESEP